MMKYVGNTFLKAHRIFSTYYLKFKIKLLVPLLNIPDEITVDHADEEAFLVC